MTIQSLLNTLYLQSNPVGMSNPVLHGGFRVSNPSQVCVNLCKIVGHKSTIIGHGPDRACPLKPVMTQLPPFTAHPILPVNSGYCQVLALAVKLEMNEITPGLGAMPVLKPQS